MSPSTAESLGSDFYDTDVGIYLWFIGNTTSKGYGDDDTRHMGLTLRPSTATHSISGDNYGKLELCFVYGNTIVVLDNCFMHDHVTDTRSGHSSFRYHKYKDYNFSLVMCATTNNELTFKMKVNRRISMTIDRHNDNSATNSYRKDPFKKTSVPPFDNRDMTD